MVMYLKAEELTIALDRLAIKSGYDDLSLPMTGLRDGLIPGTGLCLLPSITENTTIGSQLCRS